MARKKNKKTIEQRDKITKKNGFNLEDCSFTFYVLLIFGITFLFFSPFIFSNKMIYGSDALNGIYSKYFYADYVKEHLALPWWNPLILAGMPTLDAFFGDMLNPLSIIQFIIPVHKALGYKYAVSIFMAGIFMFIFLRKGLSFKNSISLFGAISFMFNTQLISHFFPGHDGKIFVISYLPLSMFALKRLMEKVSIRYSVLLAVSIGLCLLTSHVQTTYFSLWGIFLFFVYKTVSIYLKEKNKIFAFKRSLFFGIAVTLGLGIGMVQFLPSYTFTKTFSVRGGKEKVNYEHATSWSIHPEDVASLIVPEFSGFTDKDGTNGLKYWGRNPFKLNNEYTGIVVLLLSVIGIILYRKKAIIKFWMLIAFGAIIYGLGGNTPFFYVFYYLIPGVKLFRAAGMIMFWFSFSVVLIACYTLNSFFDKENDIDDTKKDKLKKGILWSLLICFIVTIFVSFGKDAVLGIWKGIFFRSMTNENIQNFHSNYSAFIKGAWFTFVFGGSVLYLFYMLLSKSIDRTKFMILIIAIALIDLFRVDSYFYKLVDINRYVNTSDPLLNEIKNENKNENFRVFPIPGHLGTHDVQFYGLESITGFHDNEIKWYRKFKGGPQLSNYLYKLRHGQIEGNPFLDLMNVKYVIYRPQRGRNLIKSYNATYLKRAFCVSEYQIEKDSYAAINLLKDPDFDYRNKIIIEKPVPEYLNNSDIKKHETDSLTNKKTCTVQKVIYDGNKRTYKVNMQKDGFLVLSEIYLPYWKAYENNKQLDVYKTNGTLMSIPLKKGNHTIKMVYKSKHIKYGFIITLISVLICILLYTFEIKRSKKLRSNA